MKDIAEHSLDELNIDTNWFKPLFESTKMIHHFSNEQDLYIFLLDTVNRFQLDNTIIEVWTSEEGAANHPLIHKINYQQSPERISEVFSSGEISQTTIEHNLTEIVIPIKGDQGIYGVLLIHTSLDAEKLKVIFRLLCDEAGQGIEKIKLYSQSKRKIKELKMLNDFILRLNTSLRFTESLKLLKEHFIETYNAAEVGFFFKNKELSFELSNVSTSYFLTEDASFYNQFAEDHFKHSTASIFIGDVQAKLGLIQPSFQTVLLFPFLDGEELIGYTLLLHPNKYACRWEIFKNIETLIFHSSLVITNALLKEELEKMAMTDPLTHLYSRRYLNKKIEKSMREDNEGTFIIIDIDNFKEVNDQYGHQVGDNVLVQVGQHILQNIRKNDIGARWGGEELAIYLPRTALDAGLLVASRLVETVSNVTNPSITVSCGISYWKNDDHSSSYKNLFAWADQALYKAKSLGKNKIIVYGHE
ncbi:MAG TPA: GGDEF domain-containing protein [Bacillus sp. (in: firmicutes)]|uniref:GGDEF domain-containing protein n=1 Tax=Bacillus litorisediminis TaxID=2922713 RepID=UPI001FAEB35D|nr:GGDEF domain-containing protein [Bacillus litorisediminis]HWO75464.1 GGDEF domain-containing protein [Bacillus sp. (in: firmicutes)]